MVLEQKVLFAEGEDANAFVAFLRKAGCPSQKVVQGVAAREEILSGTLDQAISWLAGEKEHCEGEGNTEDASWFRTVEESYRQAHAYASGLLQGKQAGDLVFTKKEMMSELMELIKSFADSEEEEGQEEAPGSSGENAIRSLVLAMLRVSNAVKETEEGFCLDRPITAGELPVKFNLEKFPPIDPERTGDLMMQMIYRISRIHMVTADPLIHIACDPDQVMDLLCTLSVPEEVFDAVTEELAIKGLAVSYIITEVEEKKSTSVSALTQGLNELGISAKETTVPIQVHVDEETVAAIVAELRKRDILAGTDEKVRMAGGKRRR